MLLFYSIFLAIYISYVYHYIKNEMIPIVHSELLNKENDRVQQWKSMTVWKC